MILDPHMIVDMACAYAEERYGVNDARRGLGPDDDLEAFGLDSVDLVCVAAKFEDQCGIAIDPVIFVSARTARQIVAELELPGVASTTEIADRMRRGVPHA